MLTKRRIFSSPVSRQRHSEMSTVLVIVIFERVITADVSAKPKRPDTTENNTTGYCHEKFERAAPHDAPQRLTKKTSI